jgi:AhpD family alkylhydroperoxidase
MTARIDVSKYYGSPLIKHLQSLGREVETAGIDRTLYELVKIRASQINGCAYCLDMHTKDARALGETEQRLYAVAAWRDTPFFSERERLALEWSEELTRLAGDEHVPQELFQRVSAQFNEAEMVALTFAVIVINSWNRLVAVAKPLVGSYVSPHAHAAAS